MSAAEDLAVDLDGQTFGTILADPPWRFAHRTGKVAPEHRRPGQYETLGFEEIAADWARKFVADKFGAATTHWAKLQSRIERGVGSPCPLLLVGVPATEVGKEKLE